ncbi:aldolase superfamily protein [Actinidia rufa]|uniref:fructose-bisphosphate aldolase n=1 Tax=Actinidia rufa TaxID=165716 RepID=A0A7J0GD80_9ERIC|nr:aldolase superfamily protein [Actinidia rufa]
MVNATYIGTPGKGILADDESTGPMGKHLSSIHVENVELNRQAFRELLFTTPGALQYLHGVILFEETLYQKTASGRNNFTILIVYCYVFTAARIQYKCGTNSFPNPCNIQWPRVRWGQWKSPLWPFVELLKEGGVPPGIKVDKGVVQLPGTNGETTTQGLNDLDQCRQKHYSSGARFAKWHAVLKIGPTEPSELSINENANGLARARKRLPLTSMPRTNSRARSRGTSCSPSGGHFSRVPQGLGCEAGKCEECSGCIPYTVQCQLGGHPRTYEGGGALSEGASESLHVNDYKC